MKIYTRTGDKGTTGLAGGERVSKASLVINAIGSIDEVNSYIGYVVAAVASEHESRRLLLDAQRHLFSCGAWLAMREVDRVELPSAYVVKQYEDSIDSMSQKLESLDRFILPGGTELAARVHVARTQVRASERAVVLLQDSGEVVDLLLVQFLNRLSDWLFTLARLYNAEAGVVSEVWLP